MPDHDTDAHGGTLKRESFIREQALRCGRINLAFRGQIRRPSKTGVKIGNALTAEPARQYQCEARLDWVK
jgi:hypothetical protein